MAVYENIDYDGLLAKMDRKSVIIDVRENHELAATGSLPNSINIPRNVISHLIFYYYNNTFCYPNMSSFFVIIYSFFPI